MEAFEQFCAVALEDEGYLVSPAVKFPVSVRTRRTAYEEVQVHGFEVDLVAARADSLVLATVKSFFGSRGVVADHVKGTTTDRRATRLYALLNDEEVRAAVVTGAANRYGYELNQVELRLYVGRFAAPTTGTHEAEIRAWCDTQNVGSGPIRVCALQEIVDRVRTVASSRQYRDHPVLVTMKVLSAAGLLAAPISSGHDDDPLVDV